MKEGLYKQYYHDIYHYCLSIVFDSDVAEDITQDVFMHFFESDNIANIQNVKNYLFVCARNLCIDHIRYNKKIDKFQTKEESKVIYQTEDDLIIKVIIKKALEKLSLDEREMLTMYYLLGYKCAEIAKIFNMSTSNVCIKLRKARTKLTKILEKEGYEWKT